MDHMLEAHLAMLMRGTEYGDQQMREYMAAELRRRLEVSAQTGTPLRVYCGYDPTAPDLHLGHAVTLRKLRQFQDLGHQAIFVIGTFTALIGDPSDQDKARPRVSMEQVQEHARTYTEQAFKILDAERTEVRYNGEWLGTLSFGDLINLAANFTVQQFLARDKFTERYAAGDPIWLHEFYYALMQGYDAVALEADVQLGATEQLFNLMAGRKLQEACGQSPQVILTFPILVGADGHTRMSKSLGNYIGLDESPQEMYGKVMSLPDEAMENYWQLVTRWSPADIAALQAALQADSLHPMAAKQKLAWEIVDSFHGAEAADRAAARFERVHVARETPDEMPTYPLTAPCKLVELLTATGLTASRSQARRLIAQQGVRLDDRVVGDIEMVVQPGAQVLQVGRRRFVRLTVG